MTIDNTKEIEDFDKRHPHPDKDGEESLYKYYSDNLEYLKSLFVEGKLYHATPNQFNDPFECKPHFNWPTNSQKILNIKKHLIKASIDHGINKKRSKSFITKKMKKPSFIKDVVINAITSTYGKLRICSYTTSHENLLLWSHYANSHKGICVEFDATRLPILYSFKVDYSEVYPEVEYPRPTDGRGFIPALVKSLAWDYEKEYRSFLVPEADQQPTNDGISYILSKMDIKNIYFGVDIDKTIKNKIIKFINKGPFSPGLWETKLSKTSFKLEFTRCIQKQA